MLEKITTTITTTNSPTTIIALNKPASTICSGFIDIHGIWNNGFACPKQHSVQYFCCGTDNDHFCCPPDRYLSEINFSNNEPIYISGQYQSSNHIIIDHSSTNSLINSSNMINKQFEQFRKFFLPIFLLTTSVLFLIGIAIWFWLYKHKAFYAMGHDDSNEENPVIRRTSQSTRSDSLKNKRGNINSAMEQKFRRMSHPSTEV